MPMRHRKTDCFRGLSFRTLVSFQRVLQRSHSQKHVYETLDETHKSRSATAVHIFMFIREARRSSTHQIYCNGSWTKNPSDISDLRGMHVCRNLVFICFVIYSIIFIFSLFLHLFACVFWHYLFKSVHELFRSLINELISSFMHSLISSLIH